MQHGPISSPPRRPSRRTGLSVVGIILMLAGGVCVACSLYRAQARNPKGSSWTEYSTSPSGIPVVTTHVTAYAIHLKASECRLLVGGLVTLLVGLVVVLVSRRAGVRRSMPPPIPHAPPPAPPPP